MADGGIDVLMFVMKTSEPLAAESFTRFNFGTAMADTQMRAGFSPGYFCELREFDFSAGVVPKKSKEDDMSELEKEERRQRKRDKQADLQERMQGQSFFAQREMRKDMIAHKHVKAAKKRDASEFVDMQPVEFSRVMDTMSPALFQSLVDCDTLAQVSVAKRKSAGSKNSGEIYLRLDFERVLLTNLDWKDSEHLIMETGTFIYRKITIRYRPQRSDGSLGPVIQSGWEMKPIPTA